MGLHKLTSILCWMSMYGGEDDTIDQHYPAVWLLQFLIYVLWTKKWRSRQKVLSNPSLHRKFHKLIHWGYINKLWSIKRYICCNFILFGAQDGKIQREWNRTIHQILHILQNSLEPKIRWYTYCVFILSGAQDGEIQRMKSHNSPEITKFSRILWSPKSDGKPASISFSLEPTMDKFWSPRWRNSERMKWQNSP